MFGLPGMLAWGAAAAIPILIHLFTRQRYRRVPWAAMEFLQRAFKKTRKRLRFEHLLLLLLRILAIVLFALALAAPRLSPASLLGGADARRQAVIVLDDSFSMGLTAPDGGTPFQQAKSQARRLINGLQRERGDSVTLITAGKPARLIVKSETKLDAATGELDKLEVGDGATDLVGALRTALAVLEDLDEGSEVVIISDLQKVAFTPETEEELEAEGSSTSQQLLTSLVQQMAARKALISFVKPKETPTDNIAITELKTRDRVVVTGVPTVISATVRNFGTRSQGGALNLHIDGSSLAVDQRDIDVIAPGESVTITFRHPFLTPASHHVEVRFLADNLETDNRRMLSLEVRDKVRVLCVDGRPNEIPSESESFFFSSALNPGGDEIAENVFQVTTTEEIRFDRTDLKDIDLLVLMSVGLISPRRADEIHRFVEDGGGLLIYLGSKTQPEVMNQRLFRGGAGVLPAEILQDSGPPAGLSLYYTLQVSDYAHPALRYFDDPNLRQLITLSPVQRFFTVGIPDEAPTTQVLATLDRPDASLPSPQPAILEKTFGVGKTILVTTSGGDPDWNSIPAMATYVILNREIAEHLTRRSASLENLIVGDSYSRILKSFASEVIMSLDGEQIQVLTPMNLEDDRGRELRTNALEQSGVYRLDLQVNDSDALEDPSPIYVSANVDPSESNLERVDAAYLRNAFPGPSVKVVDDVATAAEGQEVRRKGRGWWWALLLAGLVLLLETAFSQIFGARSGRDA